MIGATLADGLGPKVLPSVLNELIKKDADQQVFAVAAGISQTNPELGRRIFSGMDVLKTVPKAAPESSIAMRSLADNYFGDALAARPDMRGAIEKSALALYADASNAKGDLKGTLDPARYQDSLKSVVTVLTKKAGFWSGGYKMIAPVPGMTQAQLADTMERLNDDDLARTPDATGDPSTPKLMPKAADGSQVTADMIRDHAKLVSVADGVYEVRFADGKQYAIDPVTGGPYRLDLRPVVARR
jgi:hypothetical protein